MFTESKVIKQITILPQTGAVNVQWANQVKKNGEVISETFERKGYEASLTGFNTEVGALDVNAFLTSFNNATLDDKVAALAAKVTAEAAVETLETVHTQALATKDAEKATALAAKDAEISALEAAQVIALAAKDTERASAVAALEAQITALEAQVTELTPPTVEGVPQVVTRRQGRQALLLAGLLDSVPTVLGSIPDPTQRRMAQIEWDDSQTFERQRPLLIMLATALGLDSAELDELFVTASGL